MSGSDSGSPDRPRHEQRGRHSIEPVREMQQEPQRRRGGPLAGVWLKEQRYKREARSYSRREVSTAITSIACAAIAAVHSADTPSSYDPWCRESRAIS